MPCCTMCAIVYIPDVAGIIHCAADISGTATGSASVAASVSASVAAFVSAAGSAAGSESPPYCTIALFAASTFFAASASALAFFAASACSCVR